MRAILDVQGLVAGYGAATVVRGVSLAVDRGEVVALLGGNGAGKTTILRAISGLADVTGGELRLDGTSLRGLSPHRVARRGVAHVPEGRATFPSLTVGETLRICCRRRRSAMGTALEVFPALERLWGRRAGLLSGGEQQMLSLARAIVAEPALVMIDEMSLGLAPVVVDALVPVVSRLAQGGAGVVVVEQHVGLALEMADRAYVVAHGAVVAEGDAEELASSSVVETAYLGELRS